MELHGATYDNGKWDSYYRFGCKLENKSRKLIVARTGEFYVEGLAPNDEGKYYLYPKIRVCGTTMFGGLFSEDLVRSDRCAMPCPVGALYVERAPSVFNHRDHYVELSSSLTDQADINAFDGHTQNTFIDYNN
jgi:hypothetical protein